MKKITTNRLESTSGPAHDDMLGILGTGIAGANQWNVKNIGDTLFPIGFLRNNSNDFSVVRIQSPHWRKHNVALDTIHVHYILDLAGTAGDTIGFTTYWTWVSPRTAVASLVNWNVVNSTLTLDQNTPANYYDIFPVVVAPSAPSVEGYGLFILARTVRTTGTYGGGFGVLDFDAHAQKDRLGSNNEFTD